jgi:hypothetical protein
MAQQHIWYRDIKAFLFNKDTIFDIIPDKSQTLVEQLNNVMRFTIYFTIIVLIVKQDVRVLFFIVFAGIITWMIYTQYDAKNSDKIKLYDKLGIAEDFYNKACVKPTKDNPFMNVSPIDYADFPNRPKACSIQDSSADTARLFEQGLHREEDDVYNKSASDRQYFTMPFTTIPNDRGSFTDWLYKTGPTFKEQGIHFGMKG